MEGGLCAINVWPRQRERLFDAQALHGRRAIRPQAKLSPCAGDKVPQDGRFIGGHIEFVAQFARVARAGDDQPGFVDGGVGEAEEAQAV